MSGYVQPIRDGRRILVPKRAEGPDGTIGDGLVWLTPGDPDYDMWDRHLKAIATETPARTGRTPGGRRVG
jgi:hypothetical protein